MMKSMHSGLAAALVALAAAGAAQAGDVVVNLKGIKAGGGVIYAGLQTREQFMQPAGVYGAKVDNPTPGTARLVIRDVRPGEYSLGVLHDANGNRMLDFRRDGRPAEGVATGPAREPLHGPPTFDQVKVDVPAEGAVIDATLWYAEPAGGR